MHECSVLRLMEAAHAARDRTSNCTPIHVLHRSNDRSNHTSRAYSFLKFIFVIACVVANGGADHPDNYQFLGSRSGKHSDADFAAKAGLLATQRAVKISKQINGYDGPSAAKLMKEAERLFRNTRAVERERKKKHAQARCVGFINRRRVLYAERRQRKGPAPASAGHRRETSH